MRRPSSLEKVLMLGKVEREEKMRTIRNKVDELGYSSNVCTFGRLERLNWRQIVRAKVYVVIRS